MSLSSITNFQDQFKTSQYWFVSNVEDHISKSGRSSSPWANSSSLMSAVFTSNRKDVSVLNCFDNGLWTPPYIVNPLCWWRIWSAVWKRPRNFNASFSWLLLTRVFTKASQANVLFNSHPTWMIISTKVVLDLIILPSFSHPFKSISQHYSKQSSTVGLHLD